MEKVSLYCYVEKVSEICIFGSSNTHFLVETETKCLIEIFQVEEKLEAGQGKTAFRRFFSRFCTPIFLEVCLFRALRDNSFEVIYHNVLK